MTETWTQVCKATWSHFVFPHLNNQPKNPEKILQIFHAVDNKFKMMPGFPQDMGEVYVIWPFWDKGATPKMKRVARQDARNGFVRGFRARARAY